MKVTIHIGDPEQGERERTHTYRDVSRFAYSGGEWARIDIEGKRSASYTHDNVNPGFDGPRGLVNVVGFTIEQGESDR